MLLKSMASKRNLRITEHGVVEGTGGNGKLGEMGMPLNYNPLTVSCSLSSVHCSRSSSRSGCPPECQ